MHIIKMIAVLLVILVILCSGSPVVLAQVLPDDGQAVTAGSPARAQSDGNDSVKQSSVISPASPSHSFEAAAAAAQKQLQDSLAELSRLRDRIGHEKIPLSKKLDDLEGELVKVRLEFQQTARLLDSRALDLNNLRGEIKTRQEEATYLSNLISEYIRNFEAHLHIAEAQRYKEPLDAAKLALENSTLSLKEIFQSQTGLLTSSVDRLFDALGERVFTARPWMPTVWSSTAPLFWSVP